MTDNDVELFFDTIFTKNEWYMNEFHGDCIYGTNLKALKKTIDLMPNTEFHKDLLFYIKTCMPSNECIEPNICFLSPDAIYEQCTEYVPTDTLIKFGFLPFGLDGGGAPYSFRNSNGKVHLTYVGDYSEGSLEHINGELVNIPVSEELLAEKSEQVWDSLSDFIHWYSNW